MKKKIPGIFLCFIVYLAAVISSLFISELNDTLNVLIKSLIFNVSLTIIIGIFSLVIKNNRFIKFYQIAATLTTLIICNSTITHHPITLIITIPLGLLLLIQLINHIINFTSILNDDGFIDYFRGKKAYPIINIGLNYGLRMITVYLINLPVIAFFNMVDANNFTNGFNVSTIISILIMVAGIIIYTISRINKMHKKDGEFITTGLYKNARFPGTFGKILVYFGIYLVVLSLNAKLWVLAFCPLIYLLVNVFLIIPTKEKQQILLNENYLERKKNTNLFLFFSKKK